MTIRQKRIDAIAIQLSIKWSQDHLVNPIFIAGWLTCVLTKSKYNSQKQLMEIALTQEFDAVHTGKAMGYQ